MSSHRQNSFQLIVESHPGLLWFYFTRKISIKLITLSIFITRLLDNLWIILREVICTSILIDTVSSDAQPQCTKSKTLTFLLFCRIWLASFRLHPDWATISWSRGVMTLSSFKSYSCSARKSMSRDVTIPTKTPPRRPVSGEQTNRQTKE